MTPQKTSASYRSCLFFGITLFEEDHTHWLTRLTDQITSTNASCVRIHTINPEILAHGQKHPEYLKILQTGTWNVIDGLWLAIAIKIQKRIFIKRRCGSDLIDDLIHLCQKHNKGIYFIGGSSESLSLACKNIRSKFQDIQCYGFSPAFGATISEHDQDLIKKDLLRLSPAVIAVCLGAPKQETWMHQNQQLLNEAGVKIAAGLGGSVDFISGKTPRAPIWMRRIGMEWLYRASIEPFRFKRYLKAIPALVRHD